MSPHYQGWDILLRAYFSEFSQEDNVVLYLLTNKFHADESLSFAAEVRRIANSIQKDPKQLPLVHVLDRHYPQKQLPRLYKAMDAFVLPTRGEGWVSLTPPPPMNTLDDNLTYLMHNKGTSDCRSHEHGAACHSYELVWAH